VLTYLQFIVEDSIALSYFIGLGGVQNLVRIAEESKDEQIPGMAMGLLHAMCAEARARHQICYIFKDFPNKLLAIITTGENKQARLGALNVLYNFLGDKDWFYEQFMELKGPEVLLRAVRSTDNELAGFSSQLLAIFCLAHPDFIETSKLVKQGEQNMNAFFGALTQMAQAYQEAGKHELAAEAYKQALKVDKNNAPIMCQLGLELMRIGNAKEGEEYLAASLAKNPKQLEASMSLVKLMLAKDKSKKTLKRATDLLLGGLEELKRPAQAQFQGLAHPMGAKVYELLVECYEQLTDLDAALEISQDWVLAYHSDPMAHASVGAILTRQKEYREALAALGTALRQNPRMPFAHYNRALCLYHLGRHDLAAEVCKEGVRVERENRDAQAQLLSYERQRAAQAVEQAKKAKGPKALELKMAAIAAEKAARALEAKPIEVIPPMYLLLGKILGQKGEWAEAATYYTMLTKASPHVPTGTYARLVQHIIPYTIHDNHK
jgi:tetratricopeptide (TPR) repeat protein